MEKIDARKLPAEALEHIRRQAFVLRKQGYTWAHIAQVCGVHVGTVLKWARRAQADSVDTVIKGGQRSLSKILCVRHTMKSERSRYATQEEGSAGG